MPYIFWKIFVIENSQKKMHNIIESWQALAEYTMRGVESEFDYAPKLIDIPH